MNVLTLSSISNSIPGYSGMAGTNENLMARVEVRVQQNSRIIVGLISGPGRRYISTAYDASFVVHLLQGSSLILQPNYFDMADAAMSQEQV
uniref:Uncharacterized protein n=1 Tax=Romanomermis culicivorax TaxID=13658 RepID=A0A915ITX3_ROMCU